MGTCARPRPQRLGAKLLAIRVRLGLSQTQMVQALNFNISTARICEYESNKREPSLLILLAYAHVAAIPLEQIVDDYVDLAF